MAKSRDDFDPHRENLPRGWRSRRSTTVLVVRETEDGEEPTATPEKHRKWRKRQPV